MPNLPSWLGGSGDDSAGDQSSNPFGGLMGIYANPQSAGLMGMAQGLLAASGPSRMPVSMGQALGAGMQGMQQNAGDAQQMQQQMLRMRAMQGLMGGAGGQPQPQQPTQPDPTMAQGAPVMGGANMGPMSGLSAGMGSMAPQMPQQAPAAPAAAGTIYGRTPQQLFQQGWMMNLAGLQGGGDLMRIAVEHDPTLAAQMPTDITKMGIQGGMTPEQIQAANQAGVQKANYIAPTALRTPIYYDPATGTTKVVPADQLQQGFGAMYGAQELAKAQNTNQQVWDPTANNGQGGMVFQTRAQVNAAAAPGTDTSVPIGIRNNNFGNIKNANGQFATYDSPQAGINAADQTLAAYGAKHGINTITGIANRWAPAGDGNNNPAQKAAAMAAASGVGVNDPINLADPATRSRILPALFDTETPGWRSVVQGGSGTAPAAPGGPMAAQPPMGVQNAANASQSAPSKQMADAYNGLSTADANYQQSREALNEMLSLAGNKGLTGGAVGLLPEAVATRISPDAATYQKAHATYVALQGKALGSGGTDASRATLDEAVPTYDKPQPAMVTGLTNQLNNLDQSHLKTQFLTPIYQQGNEKAFTQQSAAFDQNIKPTMMPVLQLQGDAQRAAVQAAIKANPALRPNFEWAFNNGLLK
jgi:hypothetical protein